MSGSISAQALSAMVKKVADAHVRCRATGESMVRQAIAIGDQLLKLKEMIPHGEWGKFCDDRFEIGRRSLRLYMEAARGREQILPLLARGEVETLIDAVRAARPLPAPPDPAELPEPVTADVARECVAMGDDIRAGLSKMRAILVRVRDGALKGDARTFAAWMRAETGLSMAQLDGLIAGLSAGGAAQAG